MSGHINNNNFQDKSLNSAEKMILRSIQLEPNYADSYVLLGHLYTNMQQFDNAEKSLLRAEQIGTQTPWLALNWADLHIKRREYDKALKRYLDVINTKTESKKAYSSALGGAARAYTRLGSYKEADDMHKKLISYEPESAWNWGNYSNFLLYYSCDIDKSIENGEQALKIMNYGAGQMTLATALYTKWAKLLQNPKTAENAQQYFSQAWSFYPYPQSIIEHTKNNECTKITAAELQKLLSD